MHGDHHFGTHKILIERDRALQKIAQISKLNKLENSKEEGDVNEFSDNR